MTIVKGTGYRWRCDGCGRYIGLQDWLDRKTSGTHEPLNEFGPERIEHFCARCTDRDKARG